MREWRVMSEIRSNITLSTDKITILHQNLQHCRAATLELIENCNELNASIMCIQEPYVYQGTVRGLPGQNLYCSNQLNPLAAIVSYTNNALIISKYTTRTCCCVLFQTQTPFLLCSVYYSRNADNLLEELSHLERLIEEYNELPIIITGDFNAWHSTWGSQLDDRRGEEILEFLCSNLLILMNDGLAPTFDNDGRQSYIDLTMTNNNAARFIKDWQVVDTETKSDHFLISFTWSVSPSSFVPKSLTRKYKTRNIDWTKFSGLIANELQSFEYSVNNLSNKQEIEKFVNNLTDSVQKVSNESLPMTKPTNRKIFWMTSELKKLKLEVNNLRRKYQRYKRAGIPNWQLNLEQYKNLSKIYGKEKLKTKKIAIRKFYTEQNRETVWKGPYRWTKNDKNYQQISTIKNGTDWTRDVQETAGTLLDQFFPNDVTCENDMVIHHQINLPYYQPNDIPFTVKEVETAIKNENDNRSPGEDAISANVVAHIFCVYPNLLTQLYNKCLQYATFPARWKISTVKIIPKEYTLEPTAKSFRPISLLNVMGKILEKLIYDRLLVFVYSSPTIKMSSKQYGFTPQKSAENAINEVTSRQRKILNDNKYGIMVSLDVSGAFDSAWWQLILATLKKFKIPANLYHLIQDYFCNREAVMPLCGEMFQKTLFRGCPQGAKCSPLFWNILYDNLLKLNLPAGCYLQAFADDAFLLCESTQLELCEQRTNAALQIISNWGKQNKLIFNPLKTQAMFITRRRMDSYVPQILMEGSEIKFVTAIKYLGIVIDRKLLWNQHVKFVCAKAKKLTQLISRTSGKEWGLSGYVMKAIYTGAIEPLFQYSCSTWIDAIKTEENRNLILSTQRLFALAIIRAYRTVSREASLVLADIIPLDLKLQMWSDRYHIKHGRNLPFLAGLTYQRPVEFTRNGHPANNRQYLTDGCGQLHSLKIYTDGSRLDDQTGCAFVAYRDNAIVYSSKFRLANYCTVFQAELFAIKCSLVWCQNTDDLVNIISDSMSALQSIQNQTSRNLLAVEIRELMRSRSMHVCLSWTRAHVGTEGNEEADRLAKEATTDIEVAFSLFPLSFAMRTMTGNVMERWDRRWIEADTGRVTFEFFPTVSGRRKWKYTPDYAATQMLTGHGNLRQYLVRFKKISNDECDCGQVQTSLHLVRDCAATEVYRREFQDQSGINLTAQLPQCVTDDGFVNFLHRIHSVLRPNPTEPNLT